MTIGQKLLPEFDQEMAKTRRMLECVPEEKFEWAPHSKSFTLGKLANHLAVMPPFAAMIVHGQGRRPAEAKIESRVAGFAGCEYSSRTQCTRVCQ